MSLLESKTVFLKIQALGLSLMHLSLGSNESVKNELLIVQKKIIFLSCILVREEPKLVEDVTFCI